MRAGSSNHVTRRALYRESGLHHGAGVTHLERERGVSAAAGVAADAPALAVVIQRPRMLRIEHVGVFIPDQLPHHGEHIVLALVNEDFGIMFVRLHHFDVAEMHVVYAVARAEIAADLNRVLAHLARHAAIESDSVARALDDLDELFPAFHRAHDLLRSAADGRGRIVGMERHANSGLLALGNYLLE